MATQITVYNAPFQGKESSVPTLNLGTVVNLAGTVQSTGVAQAAALEMFFVNDGYTILFVCTGAAAVTGNITIKAVPDNAGRAVDIVSGAPAPLIPILVNQTRAFGPFRPIWWNSGGVVNLTFSNADNITVSAVSFKF